MHELRIGLLTHSVNPRGGVVHTLALADALHDRGHRVTVFAPALPGQSMFRVPRCALDLVPVAPHAGGLADTITARRQAFVQHLSCALRAQHFDVLHAQDGIGGNALADLCEARAIGGYVRTVHHLDHFDDPRVSAWQERSFLRASQVLCVGDLWVQALRRDHGVHATRVHNGVDLRRYTPNAGAHDAQVAARYGIRPAAHCFLAVGGIEERKNTRRTLEAFAAVHRTDPLAQLVIAGGATLLDHDAYVQDFHRVLRASGLACGPLQPIVITGAVPDADMPALYRRADAVLMPSVAEGFGLVVLEALACGAPVVVSRIAPFTEYLSPHEDVDHCTWADPTSPASIAAAIGRALDPAHAAALAAGVPEVCLRHSWSTSAREHEVLYRAHLALRAPTPHAVWS